MYRALIVDDEPMICEGLKAIVNWREHEFDTVDTLNDSEAALSFVEKYKPDLLITDIRMPKMDGIKLLQDIRSRQIDTRVIVLSGYDDFKYVRSMAVLGIENYLLKPVNEEEMDQTIENAVRKLKRESDLRIKAQLDINLIRENIINRWIYGSIGDNELIEKAEFLGLDLDLFYYQPCILRILGQTLKPDNDLKNKVYKICVGKLAEFKHCYYSQNYDGDTIAIFRGNDLTEETGKIRAVLQQCTNEVMKQTHAKLYISLGDMVQNYWKVSESFHETIKKFVCLNPTADTADNPSLAEGESVSPFSLRLAEYVRDNYEKDLSLKTLSLYFKGNAAYIGQIFKRDFGESFTDYLKKIRIEKARELLQKGNYSVKEISSKVGFQNTTYFFAVFKQEMGLSPVDYRKSCVNEDNFL